MCRCIAADHGGSAGLPWIEQLIDMCDPSRMQGSGGGAGPRKPATAPPANGHAAGRQCNAGQNGSHGRPSAGYAGHIHNCSATVAYWQPGQKLRKEDLPYPRPNTWSEEAVAVGTMLIFFG